MFVAVNEDQKRAQDPLADGPPGPTRLWDGEDRRRFALNEVHPPGQERQWACHWIVLDTHPRVPGRQCRRMRP